MPWGSGAESGDTDHLISLHSQSFAAGGQDPHPRTRIEQPVHKPGGSLYNVLAVVQNQEHLPISQDLRERVGDGLSGPLGHPQRIGHRLGHQYLLGEGSKLHQPHPIRVGLDEAAGHL